MVSVPHYTLVKTLIVGIGVRKSKLAKLNSLSIFALKFGRTTVLTVCPLYKSNLILGCCFYLPLVTYSFKRWTTSNKITIQYYVLRNSLSPAFQFTIFKVSLHNYLNNIKCVVLPREWDTPTGWWACLIYFSEVFPGH